MKRVKQEPGGSRAPEERELAYYIHDRVDLMHQVFSLLRSRELRAMGPECVRNLGKEDLMELCLEELLGISSKRLCAILDGADPPTDTSSSDSDSERLETVSLDSISSDELQEKVDKKKKKCKHKEEKPSKKSTKSVADKVKSTKKNSKSECQKKNKNTNKSPEKTTDKSEEKHSGAGESHAAERAGMTVLELLELQARARAIRAQLALEHSKKASAGDPNAAAPPDEVDLHSDSDDSVEIKEEPAQVVELLSSDEEDKKPYVAGVSADTTVLNEAVQDRENQPKVTKKNDLTIIVPVTPKHRKVKLNRSKSNTQQMTSTINGPIDTAKQDEVPVQKTKLTVEATQTNTTEIEQIKQSARVVVVPASLPETKDKDKKRKIKKVKKVARRHINDGSDHDEITLQLSDSEKMDLLEDLDRKTYDNVTSSECSDEEEEHIDSDSKTQEKVIQNYVELVQQDNLTKDKLNKTENIAFVSLDSENTTNINANEDSEKQTINTNDDIHCNYEGINLIDNIEDEDKKHAEIAMDVDISSKMSIVKTTVEKATVTSEEKTITITSIKDIPILDDIIESNLISKDKKEQSENFKENTPQCDDKLENCFKNSTLNECCSHDKDPKQSDENCEAIENKKQENTALSENNEEGSKESKSHENSEKKLDDFTDKPENVLISTDVTENPLEEKEKSEGELSDNASSEVEMFEPTEEIVCISDDEVPSKKKKKEKKKKEKKSKKEKKDFRERGDQNFSDESASESCTEVIIVKGQKACANNLRKIDDQIRQISEDLDKVNSSPNSEQNSDSEEIYEISDGDDSCCEVNGVNISKEPTCEEIEALSAKIDTEIEREDIITEEEIRNLENKDGQEGDQKEGNLADICWKDRYLDSSKVKKVLKTSNILNAMRKKNIELKKKLAERKITETVEKQPKPDLPKQKIEEGSIDHFNTLQSSTKYVDVIKQVTEEHKNLSENSVQQNVTHTPNGTLGDKNTVNENETEELNFEMKKDAKQLFKMYKRLLKYNNLDKPTDPSKAKKKKNKKQKRNKTAFKK